MSEVAQYRICPRCARAVPIHAKEHYCINDGVLLLEKCPNCKTKIYSPYTRHCAKCGFAFEQALTSKIQEPSVVQTRTQKRPAHSRFVLLLGVAAALLVAVWLAQPKQAFNMVFVGKIPESRVFIAIAFQDSQVLAYACDGQKIAEWFKGTMTKQNTLELKSKNGALLMATLDAQSARGSLELPIGNFAFAAIPARGQAALYRAESNGAQKAVAGWIVLPTGEQRSALVSRAGVQPIAPITKQHLTELAALGFQPKMVKPNGFGF